MRNAPPPNKKRKIKTITEEKIDFDPAAREEYLTGFTSANSRGESTQKRKMQRKRKKRN